MNDAAFVSEHAATFLIVVAILAGLAVCGFCALVSGRVIERRQKQRDAELQGRTDSYNAHLEQCRAAHYDEARVAEHLRRIADMDPEP